MRIVWRAIWVNNVNKKSIEKEVQYGLINDIGSKFDRFLPGIYSYAVALHWRRTSVRIIDRC